MIAVVLVAGMAVVGELELYAPFGGIKKVMIAASLRPILMQDLQATL
jgi:hypothetical protein